MSHPLPTEPTPPSGADPGSTTPPATPPTVPPANPPAQDETDWKAEARKWEKRAKENSTAAEQLEKHKASAMSEAEKAVAAAKAEGRTEAAREYGRQVAEARFEAAIASKGLDLDDFRDLIDFGKFVTEKGETDTEAIKKAVAKLTKIATPKAGRSGGEMPGAPGGTSPITEEQLARMSKAEIATAYEKGLLKHLL